MVTDDSYTGGKHSITYRIVKSLFYTPKTNVILCVSYTSITKEKEKRKRIFSLTENNHSIDVYDFLLCIYCNRDIKLGCSLQRAYKSFEKQMCLEEKQK